MSSTDFNLLVDLDVLLAEGNVARAARRLRLSPSAMSRALARLRETTGDPLLVRAGRGLVHTPRALFRDRYVGVVRMGHRLSKGAVTPARYASGKHILVSRKSIDKSKKTDSLLNVPPAYHLTP
jgi:Bacterial regulatory helix-turn-helix protein, lysR family